MQQQEARAQAISRAYCTAAANCWFNCHLLGSGNQLHTTGIRQPALTLSHRTRIPQSSQGTQRQRRVLVVLGLSAVYTW